MNWYNGFSPKCRLIAFAWYKSALSSGEIEKPTECMACRSTKKVQGHSEDYSEPFGKHIGKYHLCWRCHMWVHKRFTNQEGWERYKRSLAFPAVFREIEYASKKIRLGQNKN